MNLQSIVSLVAEEIAAAQVSLAQRGIRLGPTDAEIRINPLEVEGVAGHVETVSLKGICADAAGIGALAQASVTDGNAAMAHP